MMPEENTTTHYTLCPNNCWPEYCGLELTMANKQIVRLRGNPHHPISQGRLCARGQAALSIIDAPDRLRWPLLRAGPRGSGKWREITWEDALEMIAARMEDNIAAGRPQANAIYHSHGNIVNKVHWSLLTPRFANICSLTLWDGDVTCSYDVRVGMKLTGYFGRDSIRDVGEHAQTVLIWAHDPATSMVSSVPWLLKVKERGGRLVVVDPRVTQTALLADLHLRPRPGTDVALAGGIAHVLMDNGWIDESFIAAHTEGWEAYGQAIQGCTPARASHITGVPESSILQAARWYGAGEPSAIDLSRGALGKQANGWNTVRAILSLAAMCGHIGRLGGGVVWEGDIRFNTSLLADERRTKAPYPLNHYQEIIGSLEEGMIDTLLVWGANPLSQWPNLPRLRRALGRVSLIVVWDLFMSHTAEESADLVLPATCWLEELGIKSGATHVYLMPKLLEASEGCRPSHWIQHELARRLGQSDFFPWPGMEAMLDEALNSPHCHGLTVTELKNQPAGLPAPGLAHPPYADRFFDTPSGKFAFYSQEAEDIGLDPLPVNASILHCLEEAVLPTYSLRLISCRRNHQFHSFYRSNAGNALLRPMAPYPTLHMHPVDAERRGIEDGTEVTMFNERGRARVLVEWTTEVPQSVVSLDDAWPALNEVCCDETSLSPQAARVLGMGGLPRYQDTFVEVRPA